MAKALLQGAIIGAGALCAMLTLFAVVVTALTLVWGS